MEGAALSAGALPGGGRVWDAREAARAGELAANGFAAPTPRGARNGSAARAALQRQRAQRANWLVLDSYRAATQAEAARSANLKLHSACLASSPRLKVWPGARKAKVGLPDPHAGDKARWRAALGVKRGKCDGFSDASRRRMFEKLAEVLREAAMPVFVTLTLPRECGLDWREAKAKLRALCKRWRRRREGMSAVWKMEPQEDGTPHFHLLVWGMGFIPWQRLAVEWSEVLTGASFAGDYPVMKGKLGAALFRSWLARQDVCEVARKAADAATRAEAIKSWRGVMSYASKYLAKEVTVETEDAGRWWGWEGRAHAPLASPVTHLVSAECAYRVIRALRRALRKRHGWQPFIERTMKIFSDEPEAVWLALRDD